MTAATGTETTHVGQQPVEAASPISSRPPASSNLDQLTMLSGAVGDEDEGDCAGGISSSNRWPRQEALALLKIRSDMDAAFRDATVKGPLWEDVSRKLAEQGFERSANKCREKFENVHKYYKRTKEGRAGRQDRKSYKFFSQLEAIHSSRATTESTSLPVPVTTVDTIILDVAPVSIGNPVPVSPIRVPSSSLIIPHHTMPTPDPAAFTTPGSITTKLLPPTATTTNTPVEISFSSNSSSSSPQTEDDDDDNENMVFEGQPSNKAVTSRKRRRETSSTSTTHMMMGFFECLMKQVMQKQEAMQQRFLELIEKREEDRIIREEAWKRQETARLAREHELMALERSFSASRDAAVINFLQKTTGEIIQLPPAITIAAPPPAARASAVPFPSARQSHMPPPERRDQQHHRHQQQQQTRNAGAAKSQPSIVSTSIPSQIVMVIREKQIPPTGHQEIGTGANFEAASSRWPKIEVLGLLKLRSRLEQRYQEAGPKGPLWEEISAAMQRMGYNRSAPRNARRNGRILTSTSRR